MDQPVMIVTGASRGLGAAVARIGAGFGAFVVLAARSSGPLQGEASGIIQAGGQALAVTADVSREADCQALIRQALDRFGRIDALVNNSGVIEPIGPVAEARAADWEQNWRVNVLAPVMLTQMALPSLRKHGGRVINISSGAGENVIGGWGAYGTAKAAINHLTRILASEEPEITALSVMPGIVDTEMQATIRATGKSRMAEENYQRLYGMFEQGRLLPPEQPGRAIACLALYASNEWSGETMMWNDPRAQALVEEHAGSK